MIFFFCAFFFLIRAVRFPFHFHFVSIQSVLFTAAWFLHASFCKFKHRRDECVSAGPNGPRGAYAAMNTYKFLSACIPVNAAPMRLAARLIGNE